MLTSWQMFSLTVILSLSPIVSLIALVLMSQNQTRLLRLISEKSGIPATTMESAEPKKEVIKIPDIRKRISIPIPGAQNWKIK